MKNKSFTLIEILVVVAIFAGVIAIAAGIFVTAIQTQRRILATQQFLDEVSYVMEYMSRAIRMAKLDSDGSCIGANLNYQKTVIGGAAYSGTGIRFENYQSICQEFFCNTVTSQMMESKGGGAPMATPIALTSTNLKINSFKVELIGPARGDNNQPRVTIFLDAEHKKEKVGLKIQTSISQRNLDI